jgi:antitoxin (DNA-binding transcriptional repressor) of toxin-antitoxin stability system
MNETVMSLDDAARCFPDLVERIHATGGAALLVKSGKPLARIIAVPAQEQTVEGLIAFLRYWRTEHPEPDDQFAEVIAESRQAVHPPLDPWE